MEYYYDYDADPLDEDYDEEPYYGQDGTNIRHILQNCIQPSLVQTSWYILNILAWCVLCRGLWMIAGRRSPWLQHTISMMCGLGALYNSMASDCLVVLFLAICSYTFLLIVDYFRWPKGRLTALVTIGLHFAYELTWHKHDEWQRIRGIQMVASMKIISLACDLDGLDMETAADQRKPSSLTTIPGLIAYMGYVFCPFTCILGPWLPYRSYQRGAPPLNVGYLLRNCWWCVVNVCLGGVFLSLSNCLVPVMFAENSWLGFRTYRDALAIRCSHYFICFLSQATFALSGLQSQSPEEAPNMFPITKPWKIELPRSLSAVVRYWNIPMHDWLKLYVYRPLQRRYSNRPAAAVLGTYAVSCLLHGVHVRVYLVLLSLGCFAVAETAVRKKLAGIFDACIAANPCRKPCTRRFCPQKPEVSRSAKCVLRLVNMCFSLMAMLHLAYLGVMMNEESEGNTEEMSVLQKWSNLNYLSHWMALVTYGINLLV